MTPESLRHPANLDLGKQEDQEKKCKNVKWCEVLEPQSTQGCQVTGDADTKGEVWVEEGKVAEGFIVCSA